MGVADERGDAVGDGVCGGESDSGEVVRRPVVRSGGFGRRGKLRGDDGGEEGGVDGGAEADEEEMEGIMSGEAGGDTVGEESADEDGVVVLMVGAVDGRSWGGTQRGESLVAVVRCLLGERQVHAHCCLRLSEL